MTFQIRPAARTSANPLIGLYGLSGSGKTYSSLLLARGLVGPKGKIVMIDTERGRGEVYAEVIDGGYDVLPFVEPFSSQRYVEAGKAAEASAPACLIIDSVSHEWEGIGGVVDVAMQNQERSGKEGLHNWKEPKIAHQHFVSWLLRTNMPVILCLRAKHKSRYVKNPRGGKMEVVRDEHASPIQEEGFIFEMTAHSEILQDHTLRVTKIGAPGLEHIFRDGETISVATGRRLAEWARNGTAADEPGPSPAEPLPPVSSSRARTKAELDAEARKIATLGTPALARYVAGLDPKRRAFINTIEPQLTELAMLADDRALREAEPAEATAQAGDPDDFEALGTVGGPDLLDIPPKLDRRLRAPHPVKADPR